MDENSTHTNASKSWLAKHKVLLIVVGAIVLIAAGMTVYAYVRPVDTIEPDLTLISYTSDDKSGKEEVEVPIDSSATPATLQDPKLANYCQSTMSVYDSSVSSSNLDTSDNDGHPHTISLPDSRDEQVYRVRKLADGQCWMIDNLKLGATGQRKLTPADTNITVDFIMPARHGNLNLPSSKPEVYYTSSGTWCGSDDKDNNWPDSPTGCGYHYTFAAATAGWADGTQAADSTSPTSICPRGWRLPTGGPIAGDATVPNNSSTVSTANANNSITMSDYVRLDQAYGGSGTYATGTPIVLPNLWSYSGAWAAAPSGYNPGSFGPYFTGYSGYYWSATLHSQTYAYTLQVTPSFVFPGTLFHNYADAMAVRCVLG